MNPLAMAALQSMDIDSMIQDATRSSNKRYGSPAPVKAGTARVGRNESCPCGSLRKHKRCCGRG